MRALVLALVASIALLACERKPSAETPVEQRERPLAADGTRARELTAIPDRVKVNTDLATVRAAIRVYRGERDAFPPSLEALDVTGLSYPADLAYDAASGTVSSQTYPDY